MVVEISFSSKTDGVVQLPKLAAGRTEGTATAYKITKKRGSINGVGVSVSGSGASVKMVGSIQFLIKSLESYNEMVKEHNISKGVNGFFGFISFGNNSSTYSKEISTALKEVETSVTNTGTVEVEMMVSGQFPNVQVTASAYIQVMEIEDDQGNKTNFAAEGGADDVGAQDLNGNNLPTADNESVITLVPAV